MMLEKLAAVKKFVALKPKKTTMKIIPTTIGRTPRFPVLMFSIARWKMPTCSAAASGGGAAS
jgi:hypothetical protein